MSVLPPLARKLGKSDQTRHVERANWRRWWKLRGQRRGTGAQPRGPRRRWSGTSKRACRADASWATDRLRWTWRLRSGAGSANLRFCRADGSRARTGGIRRTSSGAGFIYRSHLQGCQPGRTSGASADQIWICHQSQDRDDVRLDGAANSDRARTRMD